MIGATNVASIFGSRSLCQADTFGPQGNIASLLRDTCQFYERDVVRDSIEYVLVGERDERRPRAHTSDCLQTMHRFLRKLEQKVIYRGGVPDQSIQLFRIIV